MRMFRVEIVPAVPINIEALVGAATVFLACKNGRRPLSGSIVARVKLPLLLKWFS